MFIAQFSDASEIVRIAVINAVIEATIPANNILSDSRASYPYLQQCIIPHHRYAMDTRLLALLQQATGDPSPAVRAVAIQQIGFADSPEALPFLMSALQDPDPAIRIAAVDGLAGIGEKNAIAPRTTAVYDEDEDVRYAAFVALKRYPYPEVIPALQHGLQEKSLEIRLIAFNTGHFLYLRAAAIPSFRLR